MAGTPTEDPEARQRLYLPLIRDLASRRAAGDPERHRLFEQLGCAQVEPAYARHRACLESGDFSLKLALRVSEVITYAAVIGVSDPILLSREIPGRPRVRAELFQPLVCSFARHYAAEDLERCRKLEALGGASIEPAYHTFQKSNGSTPMWLELADRICDATAIEVAKCIVPQQAASYRKDWMVLEREDFEQEGYLQAQRAIRRWDPQRAPLVGFLARVVQNRMRDLYRWCLTHPVGSEPAPELSSQADFALQGPNLIDVLDELIDAMDRAGSLRAHRLEAARMIMAEIRERLLGSGEVAAKSGAERQLKVSIGEQIEVFVEAQCERSGCTEAFPALRWFIHQLWARKKAARFTALENITALARAESKLEKQPSAPRWLLHLVQLTHAMSEGAKSYGS